MDDDGLLREVGRLYISLAVAERRVADLAKALQTAQATIIEQGQQIASLRQPPDADPA